jgi:2-C-methyl-D-erythritol 4-phosphate cytidylyltransferase/2-C-methyl-D-erythritol 2,4-cyclodiphosphate synthase|tara:strand:- start:756 stop:1421 length:666 start_codon:yes stop_codon:yes gene_type:complete
MDKLKIRNSVIIVAAGRGQRAGGVKPKQWQTILGKRVVDWTVSKFFDHPLINEIILVTDSIEEAKSFPNEVIIVKGGYERSQSVLNGLLMVSDNISNVLIHDAARPCVTSELISSIIKGLAVFDCVIPILPITDALWEIDRNKINLVKSLDRNLFKTTQTPQGFNREKILKAYQNNYITAADDAAIALKAGMKINTIGGESSNIKITHPKDFKLAEFYMEN